MFGRSYRPFLPRLRRRDEADFLQRQLFQRVARQLQMTVMDRIEAAAEQSDRRAR
jgi:hypothetical protein